MAADIVFEVKIDQSKAVIRELERRVMEGLEVCAGTIVDLARNLCPVGTEETTHIIGYQGGSLRSTIRQERVADNEIDVKAGGMEGIFRYVDYAAYVELGTYKMDAQPFLTPAIKDHLDEYKQILERAVQG